MLVAKDDAETPNVTRHAMVDQGVLASRQIDGGHGLALLTSAVRAIRWNQNLSNISIKRGYIVGPTKSVSLSEMPLENWAEASRTTLTLVVVIWSVQRKVDVSLGGFCWLCRGTGSASTLHHFGPTARCSQSLFLKSSSCVCLSLFLLMDSMTSCSPSEEASSCSFNLFFSYTCIMWVCMQQGTQDDHLWWFLIQAPWCLLWCRWQCILDIEVV